VLISQKSTAHRKAQYPPSPLSIPQMIFTFLAWPCENLFAPHSCLLNPSTLITAPSVVWGLAMGLIYSKTIICFSSLLYISGFLPDEASFSIIDCIRLPRYRSITQQPTQLKDGRFTVHKFLVLTSAELHQSEYVFRSHIYDGIFDNPRGFLSAHGASNFVLIFIVALVWI
jgi:hypothetical protein